MARTDAQNRVRLNARLKREKALEGRIKGMPWELVARYAGYASAGSAHQAVQELLESVEVESAAHWRAMELARLLALEQVCWNVLEANHIHVSQSGKVVKDLDPETGEEYIVIDHAPVLEAAGELLRMSESRRKLLGIDAPTRTKLEIEETDKLDSDIEELIGQMSGGMTAEEAGSIG